MFLHTGGADFDQSKPVVVLIHGAGMDHTVWRYQTRALAHLGFSPLAIDLPGHGRSEGEPAPVISDMAAQVLAVLDRLGVDRFLLVGHSMGAFVVLSIAQLAPGRVQRAVLLGTSDAMAVHPELLEAAQAGNHHAVDLIVGWSHTGGGRFAPRSDPGWWNAATSARLLEQGLERSLGSDLAACAAFETSAVTPGVTTPTLIVVGTADRMANPAAGRKLAAMLSKAEVAEVESGHMGMLDAAVEVQGLIVDWFTKANPVTGPA